MFLADGNPYYSLDLYQIELSLLGSVPQWVISSWMSSSFPMCVFPLVDSFFPRFFFSLLGQFFFMLPLGGVLCSHGICLLRSIVPQIFTLHCLELFWAYCFLSICIFIHICVGSSLRLWFIIIFERVWSIEASWDKLGQFFINASGKGLLYLKMF